MKTHHKKGRLVVGYAALLRRLSGDDLVIIGDYIIHHIYEFNVIEM